MPVPDADKMLLFFFFSLLLLIYLFIFFPLSSKIKLQPFLRALPEQLMNTLEMHVPDI